MDAAHVARRRAALRCIRRPTESHILVPSEASRQESLMHGADGATRLALVHTCFGRESSPTAFPSERRPNPRALDPRGMPNLRNETERDISAWLLCFAFRSTHRRSRLPPLRHAEL